MIKTLYKSFQHWSDGGNVWLISDTHFDDFDCKYMDPEWPTPKEHIKIINHYVKKNDTVIHLGDVGDPKYIKWMDGRYKVLIKGNHDKGLSKYENYFDELYDGPLFISKKILLSHEHILGYYFFNIHGHDHNKIYEFDHNNLSPIYFNDLNLASNIVNYRPVSLKDIVKVGVLNRINDIHRIQIDRLEINNEDKIQDGVETYFIT